MTRTESMSDPERAAATVGVQVDAAAGALRKLRGEHPALAGALASLAQILAEESLRTPRFARDLEAALAGANTPAPAATTVRRAKRAAGAIDPFAVHRDVGEPGLRAALAGLDTDRLKDIVAEHAMDYDRRAMRWRSADRLRDRIVERVMARATKGDAFRV